MELDKHHRQEIRSLSKEQLDADAQLARLLSTTTRDERVAKGVMLFFNQKVAIYNKENAERFAEEQKAKAAESQEVKPKTWKDYLMFVPE